MVIKKFFQIWCFAGFASLALGVLPGNAEETSDYIHYQLGVRYKSENKPELALMEFQRVLAAYPDNYNSYMHMGELYLQSQQPRLAVFSLKKALTYNPGWSKAHRLLAQAYEKDGQLDKVIMELQLYQQSCDPAEHDSIQSKIDQISNRLLGKPGAEAKATHTSVVPLKADSLPKPSPAKHAGPVHKGKTKPIAKEAVKATNAVDPLFDEGVDLYNNQRYSESLKIMQQVLAKDRSYAGAYYYAGLIRRRNGNNAEAKINFTKALEFPELGYNAHFYLGKILGEEKQFSTAISHLEAYIQKTTFEPGEREARQLITQYRAAASMVNVQQAPEEIETEKPQIPLDLSMEKEVKERVYQPFEIRIDTLLSMVVVDTLTDPGYRMLQGVREFQKSAFDKAITEFKKVVVGFPKGVTAAPSIYNIGICYFKMRLFAEADNQFRQLIERYPTHALSANALFLRGVGFLERKENQRGEKIMRDFILANPKHVWIVKAYEKLGDAYLDMEKPKMAIDAYTQALRAAESPEDRVFVGFKAASAYMAVGNTAKGLAGYQGVIDEGEKNRLFVRVPDSYYKIADYWYQQKDFTKASDLYRRVTRKYPHYQETPWGLFQLGNAAKNSRNFAGAVDTYKELMKRFPDDYWARQAQWKLDDAIWESEYRSVLK